MRRPGSSGPLAVPGYRWLFTGQVVSAIGDQLFPIAVVALVVNRGGDAGELGLVLAARFAALVLFAVLGGVWADRLPRVAMMRAADLLRLVAVAGLAVSAATGDPPTTVLAALVFVVGAGEAFFRPAYGALLPTVLPARDLPAGNALSEASQYVAQVAGPGLAGALLLVSGPGVVFAPLVVRDAGASPSAYGLVLAVGAAGGLLGALVAGRWRPAHPGRAGLLALLGWTAPPLALLLEAPVWLLATAWFVGGAGLGPFNIWWASALQTAVPRELLARVFSLDWLCSLALLPLGLALTGPAVALLGRDAVLTSVVLVMVVTSVLPLLVPGVKDLRDDPVAPRATPRARSGVPAPTLRGGLDR